MNLNRIVITGMLGLAACAPAMYREGGLNCSDRDPNNDKMVAVLPLNQYEQLRIEDAGVFVSEAQGGTVVVKPDSGADLILVQGEPFDYESVLIPGVTGTITLAQGEGGDWMVEQEAQCPAKERLQ